MGISDFFDNITDLDALSGFITDLVEITTEFKDEMVDICMNEGVEVLKATPAAAKEVADILAPIVSPTPLNTAKAAHTLKKVVTGFSDD